MNPDPPQTIPQPLTHTEDIVSNQPHGQTAQRDTLDNMPHGDQRPVCSRREIAETMIAHPSIHYKILTPGETLLRIRTLTLVGILLLAGVPTRVLEVAGILTGILILAKIPTLVRTFTRVLTENGILALEENETWGRTEHQAGTGLEPLAAGTRTRIPMSAGSRTSHEINISDGTEHQLQTKLEVLAAESRPDWGGISGLEMEDI